LNGQRSAEAIFPTLARRADSACHQACAAQNRSRSAKSRGPTVVSTLERRGTVGALPLDMRILPPLLTLSLLVTTFGAGCLGAPDELDDAQPTASQTSDLTAIPLCADQHLNLQYPPESCGGGLQRTCTDHITMHYVPVFKPPTPAGGNGIECKLTGTDVTTTCSPCR
jgi:hypothetical protein